MRRRYSHECVTRTVGRSTIVLVSSTPSHARDVARECELVLRRRARECTSVRARLIECAPMNGCRSQRCDRGRVGD